MANDLEHEYCSLPHQEINSTATETVILIHGAFTDSTSWRLVIPYLSDYHLLLPDLPSHGIARHVAPFSVTSSALLLRELIARRGHGGVAKVVGFSLGGQVAVRLISEYPEVVNGTAFVSGVGTPTPPESRSTILPYAAWMMQRVEYAIPRPLIRWLMDGADLDRPNLDISTLALARAVFAPEDSKWPVSWPARTLVVAAGKGGIIPSQDNLDTARRLADIGKESNPSTRAVTHPNMRHPWICQAPRLFAAAVEMWFSQNAVLEEFVAL